MSAPSHLEPDGYRILVAGLIDDGFKSTNNGFDKIVTAVEDFIPPGERQAVRVVVVFGLGLPSHVLTYGHYPLEVAGPTGHVRKHIYHRQLSGPCTSCQLGFRGDLRGRATHHPPS